MSINYAEALSPYPNKGKLGSKEILDKELELTKKIDELTNYIKNSKFTVVLTGAGISTSAGIPDFRGPNGVWTLEKKQQEPKSIDFSTAEPTYTHYALVALEKAGKIKHLISQNVDNLHIRSGFPVNRLLEVHGNCFVDQCGKCKKYYFQKKSSQSIGCKKTGQRCDASGCRGYILDTVLDWDGTIPEGFETTTKPYLKKADLLIVLGSSLQIRPVGNLPTDAKKSGTTKVVYVNLQKINRKAFDLSIHAPVDEVFRRIIPKLNITLEESEHAEPVLHSSIPLEDDGVIKDSKPLKKFKKEKGEINLDDSIPNTVSQNLVIIKNENASMVLSNPKQEEEPPHKKNKMPETD